METKVLTQEELQQLKSIQEKRAKFVEQFGILEMRVQEINIQKELLKEELKALQQEETKTGEALQQKYGNGSIDLSKGEFISQ
jgi:hypothetical protein